MCLHVQNVCTYRYNSMIVKHWAWPPQVPPSERQPVMQGCLLAYCSLLSCARRRPIPCVQCPKRVLCETPTNVDMIARSVENIHPSTWRLAAESSALRTSVPKDILCVSS